MRHGPSQPNGLTCLHAEDSNQRQLEARQQRRREHVARLARQLYRPRKPFCRSSIDPDDVDLGIDEPVLLNAGAFVQRV
jgi:hypothetical protein